MSRVPLLHECLSVFWVDLSAESHTQTNAQLMNQSCQTHTFPVTSQTCPAAWATSTQLHLPKSIKTVHLSSRKTLNVGSNGKLETDMSVSFFHKSPGWKSVRKTWKLRASSIQVVSQALIGKYKYCFKVVFSSGVLKCVPAGTGR